MAADFSGNGSGGYGGYGGTSGGSSFLGGAGDNGGTGGDGGGGGGGIGGGGGGGYSGGGGGGVLAPTAMAAAAADRSTPGSVLLATSNTRVGNGLVTFEAVCYLRGTRILTPTGEVPVEALRIGDCVVTRFHGIQPIRWIGRQSYPAGSIDGDRDRTPVTCIRAGALGEHMPARNLFVSSGHSMLLDGVLVLAKLLINGITVLQDPVPRPSTTSRSSWTRMTA